MDDPMCRLCSKAAINENLDPFDEIKIEMLKVLPLNLNLDVTENPGMCTECMASLEESFQFKSTCLYSEDHITPYFENNDVLDLKEFYQKVMIKESNCDDIKQEESVCRLCLTLTEYENCLPITRSKNNNLYWQMFVQCLPELNLTSTTEVTVCFGCLESLQKVYNFMNKCLDVEGKIQTYITSSELKKKNNVLLKDVFQITDWLKESKLKGYSDNQTKDKGCSSEMLEENLECKVETKYMELDEAVCIKEDEDSHQEEVEGEEEEEQKEGTEYTCIYCHYSTKVLSLLRQHYQKHKGDDNKYQCRLCSYKSNQVGSVRRHLECHKRKDEVTSFQCPECLFKTRYAKSIKNHMAMHNREASIYKCSDCGFETKDKQTWKEHQNDHDKQRKYLYCADCDFQTTMKWDLVRHMAEQGHSQQYKCPQCSYITKNKNNFKRHKVCHHVFPKLFACKECDFKTRYERSLNLHRLTHEEAAFECHHCHIKVKARASLVRHLRQVHQPHIPRQYYYCDQCKFKCKQKGSLVKHMDYHKRPEEIVTFSCSHCPFTTIRRAKLKLHMRQQHETEGEVKMHKCPECDYETKWRYNLKHHQLKHRSASDTTMHKCSICDYQTKYQNYLNTHIKNHEGTLPVFKCDKCDHTTNSKSNMTGHYKRKHRSLDEVETFKCDQCDFVTKSKSNLVSHKITHADPKTVQMYKCKECDFETKHRSSLCSHMKTHRSTEMYGCKNCDYKSKYMYNLRRHLKLCKAI